MGRWVRKWFSTGEADPVLVASLGALLLYGVLLDHEVAAWDTAEMQVVPYVVGIAHAPSYPLFTLLAAAWARVPLGGEVARMNLFSALLFAVATGLLVVILRRLGVGRAVASTGALVFAFAGGTIVNATQIEVQSLHLALLAGLLLAVQDVLARPTRRGLIVAALIVGAGMAHHGLMIATGPPILVLVVLVRWRALLRPDVLVPAVSACVAPLLFFLYPVLTESHSRMVNSDSITGWLDVFLTRKNAGSIGGAESFSIWWDALGDHIELLRAWMGVLPLLAAIVGLVLVLRRNTVFGLMAAAVAAIASYTQANATDINNRYLLSVVFVVALFATVAAGSAIDQVTAWVRRGPVPSLERSVLVACCVLLALVPATLARDALDIGPTGDEINRQNGEQVLAALPPDCILWAYWDLRTTLAYLHFVEGVRPDVDILDHRANAYLGGYEPTPTALYDGVQADPETAGRPVCYVAHPFGTDTVREGLEMVQVATTITPWGRERAGNRPVYLIRAVGA